MTNLVPQPTDGWPMFDWLLPWNLSLSHRQRESLPHWGWGRAKANKSLLALPGKDKLARWRSVITCYQHEQRWPTKKVQFSHLHHEPKQQLPSASPYIIKLQAIVDTEIHIGLPWATHWLTIEWPWIIINHWQCVIFSHEVKWAHRSPDCSTLRHHD